MFSTIPRAALAGLLVAVSAPAQYLAVHAFAPNASGSPVITASLGDVDGNGLPEAFLQTSTTLSMIPNVWTATPAQIATPLFVANCLSHTFARVNADAFPDLVIAVQSPSSLTLRTLLGTGTGTFGSPTTVANITPFGGIFASLGPPNLERNLLANDFNGDGLDDVVVLGTFLGGILLNAGATWPLVWSYTPAVSFWETSGHYVRLGDFNGDGLKDLVSSGPSLPQSILVWYGVPGGLSTTPVPMAPPVGTNGGYLFEAGDVDGDGYDDAVLREPINSPFTGL
jgi:hypothetical protein